VAGQTFTVPVQLPLAPNPNYQLTGGISIIEATWKSGADKLPGPRHGVYCAPLRTWFFAASDGRAVAYERVPVEHPPLPPTAPPGFVPKPWKWTVRELPAVGHPFALDEFGRGEDGSTAIILDAATFGDLLDVPKQEQKLYDQRSETAVPAGKLWAVLARAREKNMSLVCYAVTPPAGEPRPQLQFLRTTGKAP
jgi:hypothetical protein